MVLGAPPAKATAVKAPLSTVAKEAVAVKADEKAKIAGVTHDLLVVRSTPMGLDKEAVLTAVRLAIENPPMDVKQVDVDIMDRMRRRLSLAAGGQPVTVARSTDGTRRYIVTFPLNDNGKIETKRAIDATNEKFQANMTQKPGRYVLAEESEQSHPNSGSSFSSGSSSSGSSSGAFAQDSSKWWSDFSGSSFSGSSRLPEHEHSHTH